MPTILKYNVMQIKVAGDEDSWGDAWGVEGVLVANLCQDGGQPPNHP